MNILLTFVFLQLLIREGISRPNACIETLSYQDNESNSVCSSDYSITAERRSYIIGKSIGGKY